MTPGPLGMLAGGVPSAASIWRLLWVGISTWGRAGANPTLPAIGDGVPIAAIGRRLRVVFGVFRPVNLVIGDRGGEGVVAIIAEDTVAGVARVLPADIDFGVRIIVRAGGVHVAPVDMDRAVKNGCPGRPPGIDGGVIREKGIFGERVLRRDSANNLLFSLIGSDRLNDETLGGRGGVVRIGIETNIECPFLAAVHAQDRNPVIIAIDRGTGPKRRVLGWAEGGSEVRRASLIVQPLHHGPNPGIRHILRAVTADSGAGQGEVVLRRLIQTAARLQAVGEDADQGSGKQKQHNQHHADQDHCPLPAPRRKSAMY